MSSPEMPALPGPADPVPQFYDPHDAARRYYPWWEQQGWFRGDPSHPGKPFVIVIPPPNVTGHLHMGHALNNTMQDALIRFHRMDGDNTEWIPGTDHAGIATQWVVERELRKAGLDRHELGREEFLRRVWDWKGRNGGQIIHQLKQLGCSCDWSRERFTLDEGLSRAVREAFVKYYEEGLIYRDRRLINWDPVARSALSDLEVVHEDLQGEMWSFAYPLADGSGEIVVATTRPETMLGDTAIAVHPDDPRYQHLIGTHVRHPILDRTFPIIGDAILVDPTFGTGAVKVTPAHDPNDFETGRRHGLPLINLLEVDGTMNADAGPYQGLPIAECRKAVKARLRELGLERGSQPHAMSVGRSQRTGAIVEPMVSTQWFVRMKPLAAPAMAAVENGFTTFVPKQWENFYYGWMRDIRDWCISRQLWWGHRVPAWYCRDCDHMMVSRIDPSECTACHSARIEQDPDVLDTWFSSALWPYSTLGWPEKTPELAAWYPTSVLITAYDIIFFWVARMMYSGLHHMGAVPFADVCIHGLIRDSEGQKMSKTKGNVVDPLQTIEKFGVDAFRFALVQAVTQGSDVIWNEDRVENARRFTNKLWQAFRFVMMNLGDEPLFEGEVELSVYDHWILARTGEATRRVREALDAYRFNDAANEIQAFAWGELCDWYLELAKGVLYGDGPAAGRRAARQTLVRVLGALARLMHPIMPFLSEEIWQRLPGTTGTVMLAPYPRPGDFPFEPGLLAEVSLLQEVVVALRSMRGDMGIASRIPLTLAGACGGIDTLERHARALRHLVNVTGLVRGERPSGPTGTLVVRGDEYFVPLADVIDVAAERARLEKEVAKAGRDLEFLEKRLSNPSYVDRAPAAVVQETREKVVASRAHFEKLQASLALLS